MFLGVLPWIVSHILFPDIYKSLSYSEWPVYLNRWFSKGCLRRKSKIVTSSPVSLGKFSFGFNSKDWPFTKFIFTVVMDGEICNQVMVEGNLHSWSLEEGGDLLLFSEIQSPPAYHVFFHTRFLCLSYLGTAFPYQNDLHFSKAHPVLVRRQWQSEGKSLIHSSCPPPNPSCPPPPPQWFGARMWLPGIRTQPSCYLCVTFPCLQRRDNATSIFPR